MGALGAFHYAKDSGNFGRNSNGRSVSVSSDGIGITSGVGPLTFRSELPTEIRRFIFSKPVLGPNKGIRKRNKKMVRAVPIYHFRYIKIQLDSEA